MPPCRNRIAALCFALLVCSACAENRQAADKVYVVSPDALKYHNQLLLLGSPAVMAISGDGSTGGGAYCEVGSDRPCPINMLTDLALQSCRKNGGRDCAIFAVGDQIVVRYEVVGFCLLKDGRQIVTSAAVCRDADGTMSSSPKESSLSPPAPQAPPKDERNLALEGALVDWIETHPAEFKRMLNSHLERSGPMPEPGLGVHSVGSVQASHRQDQAYEITVSYVLTRGGLPRSSTNYNRPYVQYDERRSFEVRFDGGDLRFL